jgi:hypothetical protein
VHQADSFIHVYSVTIGSAMLHQSRRSFETAPIGHTVRVMLQDSEDSTH